MSYGLGVDLGTTYTAAAVRLNGHAEVARLGSRRAEIPSLVFVRADGGVLIGEAAERRGSSEPFRLAREFKRRIGDPVPLLVGGSPYPAHALMARLLEEVLGTVTRQQEGPPTAVTVTYPANWGPYKRDLLGQAVRLADLRNVTLRAEPEAAAVRYAATERIRAGETVAVYDLGGGTFDAAVLRKTGSGFELLGEPEGIEQLGGIDFDEAVLAFVTATLGPPVASLDPDDPSVVEALARLRRDCVEAKEALSYDTEVMVPVALPNLHTRVRLNRSEFEAMIMPAVLETIAALRRALRSAGVEAGDLRSILLSGGSSRIPLVSQLLSVEFGRPVVLDPSPEHSIALGAALVTPGAADEPAPPAAKPADGSPSLSDDADPPDSVDEVAAPAMSRRTRSRMAAMLSRLGGRSRAERPAPSGATSRAEPDPPTTTPESSADVASTAWEHTPLPLEESPLGEGAVSAAAPWTAVPPVVVPPPVVAPPAVVSASDSDLVPDAPSRGVARVRPQTPVPTSGGDSRTPPTGRATVPSNPEVPPRQASGRATVLLRTDAAGSADSPASGPAPITGQGRDSGRVTPTGRAQVAPTSGAPVHGAPVSGAPLAGSPVSGAPVSGAPLTGAPGSGPACDGVPGSGAPLAAAPLAGVPVSGAPSSAAPVSGGAPVSGSPVSGSPAAPASGLGSASPVPPVPTPPTSTPDVPDGGAPARSGLTPSARRPFSTEPPPPPPAPPLVQPAQPVRPPQPPAASRPAPVPAPPVSTPPVSTAPASTPPPVASTPRGVYGAPPTADLRLGTPAPPTGVGANASPPAAGRGAAPPDAGHGVAPASAGSGGSPPGVPGVAGKGPSYGASQAPMYGAASPAGGQTEAPPTQRGAAGAQGTFAPPAAYHAPAPPAVQGTSAPPAIQGTSTPPAAYGTPAPPAAQRIPAPPAAHGTFGSPAAYGASAPPAAQGTTAQGTTAQGTTPYGTTPYGTSTPPAPYTAPTRPVPYSPVANAGGNPAPAAAQAAMPGPPPATYGVTSAPAARAYGVTSGPAPAHLGGPVTPEAPAQAARAHPQAAQAAAQAAPGTPRPPRNAVPPQPHTSRRTYRAVKIIVTLLVIVGLLAVAGAAYWFFVGDANRDRNGDGKRQSATIAQWVRKADVPLPLEGAAVAAYQGKLWVAGGQQASDPKTKSNEVFIYDPASDDWTVGPSLPSQISHATLVAAPSGLHLVGGWLVDGGSVQVLRLDGNQQAWTQLPPLPESRVNGIGGFTGSEIVYAGGTRPGPSAADTVWALRRDAWVEIGRLSTPRQKAMAAGNGTGTLWIMGGRNIQTEEKFGTIDLITSGGTTPSDRTIDPPVDSGAGVYIPDSGICVVGGQTPNGGFNDWWCWEGGLARKLPALNPQRGGLAAAIIDRTIYVVGGYGKGFSSLSRLDTLTLPTR